MFPFFDKTNVAQMRQFQGEYLDFGFLKMNCLLCLVEQRLNQSGQPLSGVRIGVQLLLLSQ
ncbi:hypothetical protein [Nitrosomonas mobilis]|uniref:hypothetical protein n=1 Tax=Nitrosomonas mobilis TaxID=51642 RepID=UPI000B7DA779|nr:hypothetical protein [Nitrosomonas mobilis]HNO76166.1 hypothetical protein [Nitrosomonas mobilis]